MKKTNARFVSLKITGAVGAAACCVLMSGCVHPIAFEGESWRYATGAQKVDDSSVVVVIDDATASATYGFRAFTTGLAHKWVAEYGEMLCQVSDVEYPQLAEHYKRTAVYAEPASGTHKATVVMSVPSYVFEDYRAKVTVRADVFGPGRTRKFSKNYQAQGLGQVGKMLNAGAFGQKSAVRQSTLDAYRQVFLEMRPDLRKALLETE